MKSINQTQTSHWVAFGVAILATVLFLIFSSQVYELLYNHPEFTNEMYNQRVYFSVGLVTSLIIWLGVIIYYLVIDHFSTFFSWIILGFLLLAAVPSATYIYLTNSFEDANFDFSAPIFNFSVSNIAVAFVLFIIATIGAKGFSTNSETTPF